MAQIQFPYRKESTRRHYSADNNRDFVSGPSRNSSDAEQARKSDSTDREGGAGGG